MEETIQSSEEDENFLWQKQLIDKIYSHENVQYHTLYPEIPSLKSKPIPVENGIKKTRKFHRKRRFSSQLSVLCRPGTPKINQIVTWLLTRKNTRLPNKHHAEYLMASRSVEESRYLQESYDRWLYRKIMEQI